MESEYVVCSFLFRMVFFYLVLLLLLLLLIHTFSVLSLQLKKLRWHNKSAIDLSNANPACGHKEVRRSTGHIMVTTRYSDQQGSKSRQKVMRLYKQWHRPISKRFIKPPYSIREQPRSTRNVVAYPRPAFSCDHGLDVWHQLMWDLNQSINQSNTYNFTWFLHHTSTCYRRNVCCYHVYRYIHDYL